MFCWITIDGMHLWICMSLQRLHVDMNYSTDVLIIGCGGAGLRAAIALHDAGRRVLVLGKRPKTDAHTVLAEGGINAALGTLDPADTWAIHAADTLKEGRFLGHPGMVERLCREAPAMIEELERWGVPFAREADGRLSQRFFGAHRYRRTCFVGDYTGLEIIRALVRETDRRQIPILERVYASHLLTAGGRVNGALGFRLEDGQEVVVQAGAVLLATGGHTHIYHRSTSRRRESTGDGMALAFAVGAPLADMELVQFHPSGMVWPAEMDGMLVTEAVRGEGGQLRNQAGERFMARYDPERLELSTRDRVALANYTEITAGRGSAHGGVWLDISHQPAELIRAAAAAHGGAVRRGGRGHHAPADGGGADRALLDGRRAGGPRHPRHPGAGPVRGGRGDGRRARREPAGRQQPVRDPGVWPDRRRAGWRLCRAAARAAARRRADRPAAGRARASGDAGRSPAARANRGTTGGHLGVRGCGEERGQPGARPGATRGDPAAGRAARPAAARPVGGAGPALDAAHRRGHGSLGPAADGEPRRASTQRLHRNRPGLAAHHRRRRQTCES